MNRIQLSILQNMQRKDAANCRNRRALGTRCRSAAFRGLAVLALGLVCASPSYSQVSLFRRGDVNVDESVDMSDAIAILETLFVRAAPFSCEDAADVNDDGRINVTDPVVVLLRLFLSGTVATNPEPGCALDLSDDPLGCGSYAGCELDPGLCLSDEVLEQFAGVLPKLTLCIPAGLLDLEPEGLEVSVCPDEDASPCGPQKAPGCPLELTSFRPFVDVESQRVGFRVEGMLGDLPLEVTESLFGTTTSCRIDLGGSKAGQPFTLDLVIPLVTTEVGSGVWEIVDVEQGMVEVVDMRLDASGGLVCALLEAGQDAFIGLIVAPLEALLENATAGLGDAVTGLRLCR